jgi:hypothetical protein
MTRTSLAVAVAIAGAGTLLSAQAQRPPSPPGTSAAQVGGRYVESRESIRQIEDPKVRVRFATRGPLYVGGRWIEISYGRPLKRGRDLWGSGDAYGQQLNAGAPVWRAGANVSTRLNTEVPLVINGARVAPGEYSLFIDLEPDNWTFIVSTWEPQREVYNPKDPTALWGSYGYTPEKDVVRAPMKLEKLPHSIEQLTWNFADMTDRGGLLTITWDTVMASVPFQIAE